MSLKVTEDLRNEAKCKYSNGKCYNERTLKRNGTMHTLCEYHRIKACFNQRKLDKKKRELKSNTPSPRKKFRQCNPIVVERSNSKNLYPSKYNPIPKQALPWLIPTAATTTTTTTSTISHSRSYTNGDALNRPKHGDIVTLNYGSHSSCTSFPAYFKDSTTKFDNKVMIGDVYNNKVSNGDLNRFGFRDSEVDFLIYCLVRDEMT